MAKVEASFTQAKASSPSCRECILAKAQGAFPPVRQRQMKVGMRSMQIPRVAMEITKIAGDF